MGRWQVDLLDPLEKWDKARALRKANTPWAHIAKATGITVHKLQMALDPEYRERRNEQAKEHRVRLLSGAVATRDLPNRVLPKDAERVLAAIPKDTRTFTARAFGDPLPGRSALDRRRAL